MAWPFRSAKGRHSSAGLRARTPGVVAAALATPEPLWTPQVGLVFRDDTALVWSVDDPHARPFVALAETLLLPAPLSSSQSPVRPIPTS